VDLVVQDDHRTYTVSRIADRDLNGSQEVRRTLGARERGVAHRARHDDRRVGMHQEIQDKGRPLYGIGTLGDDDATCPGIDVDLDLSRQLDQILEVQLRAGHLP